MKVKLAIPLVLFLALGQIHSFNFKVEKFSDTNPLKDQDFIGLMMFFGETDEALEELSNDLKPTGFGCLQQGGRYHLSLLAPQGRGLEPNLNFAIDSHAFESWDDFDEEVDWDEKKNICFLFGTWWPAETNGSKKVEIYVNFLSHFESIGKKEVFYLKAVALGGLLESSVYLTKDKEDSDEAGDDDFPIPEIDPKKLEDEENLDMEALEALLKRRYANSELISRFAKKGQTIVGNLQCKTNDDFKFGISFDLTSVDYKGDGEFNMAFITEEIRNEDEQKALKEFAESDSTDMAITNWAILECRENVLDFSSMYEFLNQEDFYRYHELNEEDEFAEEDQSELFDGLAKQILKKVEENKGKLKVTIEYEGNGHTDENEGEYDDDEYEDSIHIEDFDNERRRII